MEKDTTNKIRKIINNPPKNDKINGRDLSGEEYSNFLVLSFDHRDETTGTAWWRVKCKKCGTIRVVHHTSVTNAPEHCYCYKVYKSNPERIIRIGDKLQQRIEKETAKIAEPETKVTVPNLEEPNKVFEFSVDHVKQAIIDLREERDRFAKAGADWKKHGISANRDMNAWRSDLAIREDNILFHILDMIEEVQETIHNEPK